VWLSSDPTFLPARATYLGSVAHSNAQPLQTGQGYTDSLTVTLPAGIDGGRYLYVVLNRDFAESFLPGPAGLYQVHVFMGLNENPLQHSGSTTIQVIYRETDLVPTAFAATSASPHAGDSVAVSWTVKNQGDRDTRTDGWEDGVFLSRDPSASRAALPLGDFLHVGVLPAGQSYTESGTVQLPQGIQGDYFLLLYTDEPGHLVNPNDDRVKEYRGEGNNVASIAVHVQPTPLADVRVTAVTPSVQHVTAGQPFDVTWAVTNQGTADTLPEQGLAENLYLARDTTFDP